MKNTVLSILLATSVLTACSHDNPLKVMPTDDVGKFLAKASWFAEKALNVRQYPGHLYYQCLMHDKNVKVDCNALYQNMVQYAHTQFQFQSVTISDLKDTTLFYKVKDDYDAAVFNLDPAH